MKPARVAGGQAFVILLAITGLLTIGLIHFVAYVVPIENSMGIIQKVFYFHAPAGYAMYLGATACFVGSCAYLYRASPKWDAFARAGADVAVAMGLILIITGALWARKGWGVAWTWDPRLTTSLLSVLLYVAYVVLRSFSGDGESERKFASALGILGGTMLPIIHYSVQKWGGNHPMVVTGKGGGLSHPDMKIAFFSGLFIFTLLAIVLVWSRARIVFASSRLARLEQEALEIGIGED